LGERGNPLTQTKKKIFFFKNKAVMNTNELQTLITEIKTKIGKHIYTSTWTSGSSTDVHPIEIYHNNNTNTYDIAIQLKANRNYFTRTIEYFKKKYADITYMGYWKSDGSCPNTIKLKVKM
jgi:hypothetical protein